MLAALLLALIPAADSFHEARLAYEGQSYKEAAKLFSPLVQEGDTLAALYLGLMARFGRGVPKDFERAAELINLATKSGDPVAQTALATLYDEGVGIAKDVAQAHALRLKAANQGYWGGQLAVAVDLAVGSGVGKDCAAAGQWFEKARASGEALPKFDLGVAMFKGCGASKDQRGGIALMTAASQTWGEKTGFYDEGLKDLEVASGWGRYAFLTPVVENPPAGAGALEWIRNRAMAGDMYGQCALAAALEKGVGLPKDAAEAAEWYAKAAAQGLDRAGAALEAMAARGAISERQLAKLRPASAQAPGAAPQPAARRVLSLKGKLAVLDLKNFTKDLTKENALYFTDVIRQTSLRLVPGLQLITRENLLVLLQSTGRKLEDCEGECEVDTGRRIGADQIVSGEIQKLGSRYKLTLRLHETASGQLLASAIGSGKSVDELDESAQKAAEELFTARQ